MVQVQFIFNLTNATAGDVVITGVRPSCGCTTTKLPALPWRLGPGMNGQIEADVEHLEDALAIERAAGINSGVTYTLDQIIDKFAIKVDD